ncbi:Ig-like domain-containing protein, partial [Stutzerimonas frequens]
MKLLEGRHQSIFTIICSNTTNKYYAAGRLSLISAFHEHFEHKHSAGALSARYWVRELFSIMILLLFAAMADAAQFQGVAEWAGGSPPVNMPGSLQLNAKYTFNKQISGCSNMIDRGYIVPVRAYWRRKGASTYEPVLIITANGNTQFSGGIYGRVVVCGAGMTTFDLSIKNVDGGYTNNLPTTEGEYELIVSVEEWSTPSSLAHTHSFNTLSYAIGQFNNPPTAPNKTITTTEDKAVSFELNAYDKDGDHLTYSVTSQPHS